MIHRSGQEDCGLEARPDKVSKTFSSKTKHKQNNNKSIWGHGSDGKALVH
jgi:hypothetical protein